MTISILFVDDDKNFQDALSRFLTIENDDITFDLAISAEDALKKLEVNKYDVIVSDHKMDKITGLTLLSIVREKYPKMKRLMLSGQVHDTVFEEAEKLAHKYLSKPCDLTLVISEIKNIFY